MSKMADEVQRNLIKAIDRDALFLPTLPEVALRIRLAAEDTEISISALSKVIGSDTALSARLIKVANSPLLRPNFEVSDVNTAIRRLGVNYTCNLAIGLVVEQMFHAKSPVIEQKMRDIWKQSLQVAGISYTLCQHYTSLKPDQATLAGLIHLIGILPILTYAEDHYELLSDPISLNHVIDSIHPVIGERLLRSWDFPSRWPVCRASSRTSRASRKALTTPTWYRSPRCISIGIPTIPSASSKWSTCLPTAS